MILLPLQPGFSYSTPNHVFFLTPSQRNQWHWGYESLSSCQNGSPQPFILYKVVSIRHDTQLLTATFSHNRTLIPTQLHILDRASFTVTECNKMHNKDTWLGNVMISYQYTELMQNIWHWWCWYCNIYVYIMIYVLNHLQTEFKVFLICYFQTHTPTLFSFFLFLFFL